MFMLKKGNRETFFSFINTIFQLVFSSMLLPKIQEYLKVNKKY